MGQKVHPLGFRVGITKKHQSQWFARFNKYKYSQSILEDRMIRDTLSKLFPELLNPILNNTKGNTAKKRDDEISITPRITQIKIERGLIPYEIGIQIHAENCELLKSAIDNLKVKRELIVKLQKTRRYLLNLKLKLKDLTNNKSIKNNLLNIGQENETLSQDSSSLKSKSSPASLQKSASFAEKRNIPSIGRTSLNSNSGRLSRGTSKFSRIGGSASKNTQGTGVNSKASPFEGKTQKNSQGQSLQSFKKTASGAVPFKFRSKLTKQELKRQRLIKKRLKKRQFIRSRYRQLILKGLFIKKSGNKVIQTLCLAPKRLTRGFSNGKGKARINSLSNFKTNSGTSSIGGKTSKISAVAILNKRGKTGDFGGESFLPKNTFSSRIKKKFVTLFIQKMNKKFLSHLKVLLTNYAPITGVQGSGLNYLPLGYSKQWSLNRLNMLKSQPIYKLNRMIVVLEQKLLIKLESLRKEFIAFGSISAQSSESLGYFQILNFLKNLKELVNKLKREQKLQLSITKNFSSGNVGSFNTGSILGSTNLALRSGNNKLNSTLNLAEGVTPALNFLKSTKGIQKHVPNIQAFEKEQHFDKAAETVLQKKLNNIEDECRKVKLIEYVKDIVKKHRTENIYFYLSTMADAGKDLRKIKQFTKRHADFLFGLNLNNFTEAEGVQPIGASISETGTNLNSKTSAKLEEKINERVSKVLEKASKKTNFEKTLQDIFLEQIEKQRTMCLENLQLTPKISIKFYSVNKKTLEQKASIVSESVVDALEKRKAFRKVVKDAKETLMRTPGVKGVKIQVAGRLNGAEIARTEWVRAGRVPLQTLRANLDYSYRTANTIYGIIGVRVWIFKGYAKLISK
jgi:ribosomal protein S3